MQVLSTDTVPSHEAFAYWRDVLAQHFVHLRPCLMLPGAISAIGRLTPTASDPDAP